MIPWQIPLVLKVIVANILAPFIGKKIVNRQGRSRRFVAQYSAACIIAWLFALASPKAAWEAFPLVFALGFVQVFGTYCYWRATAISLSATAFTTQFDDVIGMLMGYVFLGEAHYLRNGALAAGILFALSGVLVFTLFKNTERLRESLHGTHCERPLYMWVAGYSIVWGLAYFGLRYFGVHSVAPKVFLTGWYSGSFLGAIVIHRLAGAKEAGDPIPWREHGMTTLLAVCIYASLYFQYWVSSLTPITVHQPIYQVTEMVFPALIGLFYFKEIGSLTRSGKIAFALGIAGTLLIALSYR